MPVKSKRARRPVLEPEQMNYFLTGGDLPFFWDEPDRDWKTAREEILRDWIRERPGTRPWAWWEYDAPRRDTATGAWFEPMPVPRERLGGSGQTTPERYPATVPRFSRGIPFSWVEIDPEDPPCYEAEAVFLDRFGFLLPEEKKRIPAEGWEPEAVR